MPCDLCSSTNLAEFTVEMMIHSDRAALEDPGVLAFPKVLTCLSCGASRFSLPVSQLRLLRKGTDAVCNCLDTGHRGLRRGLLSRESNADQLPAAQNRVQSGE